MKKIFAIFFITSVLGLVVGGAYGLWIEKGWQAYETETAPAVSVTAPDIAMPQDSKTPTQPSNDRQAAIAKGTVTNPNKSCSTLGCDNAVFVTYKDNLLCVKCYGEAKVNDTQNAK